MKVKKNKKYLIHIIIYYRTTQTYLTHTHTHNFLDNEIITIYCHFVHT